MYHVSVPLHVSLYVPRVCFWDVGHVPCLCISPQSCQPPMWIVSAVCRVSKDRVPICFVGSLVCSIVFWGVCLPIIVIAVGRTFLAWLWCRRCHLWWLFLWAYILQFLHQACCLVSHGWIRDGVMVSWGRSWICPLSWSVRPSWRLRCWIAFLPPAFPRWDVATLPG